MGCCFLYFRNVFTVSPLCQRSGRKVRKSAPVQEDTFLSKFESILEPGDSSLTHEWVHEWALAHAWPTGHSHWDKCRSCHEGSCPVSKTLDTASFHTSHPGRGFPDNGDMLVAAIAPRTSHCQTAAPQCLQPLERQLLGRPAPGASSCKAFWGALRCPTLEAGNTAKGLSRWPRQGAAGAPPSRQEIFWCVLTSAPWPWPALQWGASSWRFLLRLPVPAGHGLELGDVSMYIYICVSCSTISTYSLYLFIQCLFIHLTMYPFIYLSIFLFFYLSLSIFLCPSLSLSIYLSI